MPALPKASHEMVAQALAAGKSQRAAYLAGGFIYKPANAHRLCTSLSVLARVDEILACRSECERKKREIAINKAALGEVWILERLKYLTDVSLRGRSLRSGNAIVDENGKPDGAVAVKCLTLAANICGLLGHRGEAGSSNKFDKMSDAELDSWLVEQARTLGLSNMR